MAYEGKCGSCDNFEEPRGSSPYSSTNAYYVKGYCSWYKTYYYPDDSCRNHYRPRGGSSGGCYITTMVHSILGMDDKTDSMETLRSFRDNVLQKDEKYKDVLYEYDTVGPMISEKLKQEDKKIVKEIYSSCLLPVVELIKENRNTEAIDKYRQMTKMLMIYYDIEVNNQVDKTYDYTTGGHGRLNTKKK